MDGEQGQLQQQSIATNKYTTNNNNDKSPLLDFRDSKSGGADFLTFL